MNCPTCGASTVEVKAVKAARYRDEIVTVEAESFRCDSCDESFVTPQQMNKCVRAVKNEVRKKNGLLPPEKIVAIRAKLGITQSLLEEALGTGPKVVVKWESGKIIQSRGHDNMLRLLERDPAVLKSLQKIQQLRTAEQTKYESSSSASGTNVGAV
jgi:putative zinc finger/helix-turn-helix YgiT family protein